MRSQIFTPPAKRSVGGKSFGVRSWVQSSALNPNPALPQRTPKKSAEIKVTTRFIGADHSLDWYLDGSLIVRLGM